MPFYRSIRKPQISLARVTPTRPVSGNKSDPVTLYLVISRICSNGENNRKRQGNLSSSFVAIKRKII